MHGLGNADGNGHLPGRLDLLRRWKSFLDERLHMGWPHRFRVLQQLLPGRAVGIKPSVWRGQIQDAPLEFENGVDRLRAGQAVLNQAQEGRQQTQVLVEQALHGLHVLEDVPTVLAHGAVEYRHNEWSSWKWRDVE